MKYALNLANDGRILSVTFEECAPIDATLVDNLPEGDTTDYCYVNNEFIYDPLPEEVVDEKPTWQDRIEAQVTYTAIVTDSLLPEEKEEI